jgi:excisionase family DNA binding protein
MGTARFSYKEAAHALGISTDAVRMRVRRGTLRSERDGSRVFVILDADEIPTGHDQGGDSSELVAVLRDQLAQEREARRRADTIILNLTQANATLASRVPALQAAAEERRDVPASRDAPSGGYPSTGSPRGDPENQSSRGWWSRLFR